MGKENVIYTYACIYMYNIHIYAIYIYTYTHIYTNGMGEWQVETIRYKIGSWEI